MRIVIDLLEGPDAVVPAALNLARDLARLARDEGADIRIAAPAGIRAGCDRLRLAFDGLLPRYAIRPLLLPAGLDPLLHAALRHHALVLLPPGAGAVEALPAVRMDPDSEDAAGLWRRLQATAAETLPALSPAQRPRLAYVSPLPPQKSGIADYSAELAPELARYYEVELIVDQEVAADPRLDGLARRPPAFLREQPDYYDRVLYHFGNSPLHAHIFELLRAVPGVVVVHDFYFANTLDHLERQHAGERVFLRALYESHGYTGLFDLRREGRNPTVWKYPANKGVLDHAAGIVVHSEYPKQLARRWYGEDAAGDWRIVPLLRGRPAGALSPQSREAARARLQVAPGEFLVCSFGMLGPTKLNEELVDAFLASPLARDPHCVLVFVGENDAGAYGAGVQKKIRAGGAARRIRITGFVDAATYADYLAACDVAVQLRASSRGETSASVLDCLLYGVPTIVNAHGSTASMPDELLVKLPDEFAPRQLATALARLHGDRQLREALAARALAWMDAEHAPERAGRLCFEAIEHFARHGEASAYRQAIEAAARLGPAEGLRELAAAIAFNRTAHPPRQLLVDVSALVQIDLKTGIQRVVRSILLSLIADPPAGYRVEPVVSVGNNQPYHYARNWGMDLVGQPAQGLALALEDAPAELRPGDVFFGLDLLISATAQNRERLLDMRDRGVRIYFCIYDLLPMLRPEVFPFGTEQHFGTFLRAVHQVADGVLCISRAVADELCGWIESRGLARPLPFQVGWFHLGADIEASAPSTGLPPDADRVLQALGERPSFLMVGTVEPRKGHAQALAAFELLWERGIDANLVIVGKEGWMVEKLAERMKTHPEKDRRLHWLAGISDEMLLKLYAGASSLLFASEGEGFGLPLIEAAQHGIPIVARSLPVFREVAGEHAYYFEGLEARDLADALAAWLPLWRAGQAPASGGMSWLTWDQSARQVVDALVGGHWYRVLPGTGE
jgi:glycosyltransferase involved in cell wall biosynthesis